MAIPPPVIVPLDPLIKINQITMVKKDIIAKLKELNIEHDPKANAKELSLLLPKGVEADLEKDLGTVTEGIEIPDTEEGDSAEKIAYHDHIVKFFAQYPEKWDSRKDELLGILAGMK